MNLPMAPRNFDHQTRELRERWILSGQMHTDRLPSCKITIRNISPYGLGAICRDQPPEVGEVVEITLPAYYHASATVRWINGQAFGARFNDPIDPHVVVSSFQRSRDIAAQNAAWEVKSRHRVTDYRPDISKLRRI